MPTRVICQLSTVGVAWVYVDGRVETVLSLHSLRFHHYNELIQEVRVVFLE